MSNVPPDELTIEIDLTVAGKHWPEMVLREPTIGQMRDAMNVMTKTNSEISMSISLVSAVTGIPPVVVEKVPMRKFREATAYLMGFSSDSPQTPLPLESNSPEFTTSP